MQDLLCLWSCSHSFYLRIWDHCLLGRRRIWRYDFQSLRFPGGFHLLLELAQFSFLYLLFIMVFILFGVGVSKNSGISTMDEL